MGNGLVDAAKGVFDPAIETPGGAPADPVARRANLPPDEKASEFRSLDLISPHISKEEVRAGDIAPKGAFVISTVPHLGVPKKRISDAAKELLTGETFSQSVNPSPSYQVETVKMVSKAPKSLASDLAGALSGKKYEVTLEASEPGFTAQMANMAKAIDEKAFGLPSDALNGLNEADKILGRVPSKTVGILGRVMSADENAIVKGLYTVSGLPEKKDFSEYTYYNYMREMGADDSALTFTGGLAASVLLSPSTYISFGTTGALKIAGAATKGGEALKTATLTGKGLKLRGAIVQEAVALEKSKLMNALDRELLPHEINKIVQEVTPAVDQELVKHFNGMEEGVRKGIKGLPSNGVFDRGGIKLKGFSPTSTEYTLMSGDQLAKVLYDNQYAEAIGKIAKTGADKILPAGTLGKANEVYNRTSTFLRESFVATPKDKDLLDIYDSAMKEVRVAEARIEGEVGKYFSDLAPKQQKDFMETMIQASVIADKKNISSKEDFFKVIGEVKSISGDVKVQDKIDQYLGIGKYTGQKTIADDMAKQLGLLENERLGIWVPGINDNLSKPRLLLGESGNKLRQDIAKTRQANAEIYTRNPVKAFTYRKMELAIADIQDKIYNNVVEKKLGGARQFSSMAEATREGYVPFVRPDNAYLSGTKSVTDKLKGEATWYVERDFANQYKNAFSSKSVYVPLVTEATNLFKAHVTSIWPAFHVRNFASNTFLNAAMIGGHAINPKTFIQSTRKVLSGGKPANAMETSIEMAHGAQIGKGLDKIFTNDIGEKVTINQYAKEAKEWGALKGEDLAEDIFGTQLPGAAKTRWGQVLQASNPFSSRFVPLMVGRKMAGAIEDQARFMNYITWRNKGLSPKLSASLTNEALFDYGQLTRFENKLKLAIPFYTFRRKNLEAQMRLMGRRPGIVAAQMKFFRELGPSEEDWEGMPDWAKSQLSLRFRGNIYGGFGIPIEDVMNVMADPEQAVETSLNPLFRYPIERMSGKDLYFDKPLEEIKSANEFKPIVEFLENPKVPDSMKTGLRKMNQWLKLKRDDKDDEKIVGNPDALHILRSSFTSRWQSTSRLLVNPLEKEARDIAVQLMTGVHKIEVDTERTTAQEVRKALTEIEKMGKKTNQFMSMANTYIIFKSNDKALNKMVKQFQKDSRSGKFLTPQEVIERKNEIIKEFQDMEEEALP